MYRATLRLATAIAPLVLLAWIPPARAEDLPKGEAVLTQYIEATGGKAAYEKVKSRVLKGTLEVTGAAIKGSLTITQVAPNSILIVTEIPGVEKGTQATDGKLAWSTSLLTGDRLLEGEEKQTLLLQAALDAEVNPAKYYAKIECTGVEDVDGKPAYKVVLTPKEGKPTTSYYDKASHLNVKSVSIQKSPMGEITVESFPSDYRKVDGISMPFVAKQKVLTQEIVITMTEVKQNVDIPADAFKVPDSIKALVDGAKKDK